MVLSWSAGCTSCHYQVGSRCTRINKAGLQRSDPLLRQPGLLDGGGETLGFPPTPHGVVGFVGNPGHAAILPRLTSGLGMASTAKQCPFQPEHSLVPKTVSFLQTSEVSEGSGTTSGNARDGKTQESGPKEKRERLLVPHRGLRVWEKTSPMRATGMDRVVIRKVFQHSLGPTTGGTLSTAPPPAPGRPTRRSTFPPYGQP